MMRKKGKQQPPDRKHATNKFTKIVCTLNLSITST